MGGLLDIILDVISVIISREVEIFLMNVFILIVWEVKFKLIGNVIKFLLK